MGDGGTALRVSMTAPPAEGRANAALIELLSREWRVPKRDVMIVAGPKSRDELMHVAGDPAALLDRVGALIAALPVS